MVVHSADVVGAFAVCQVLFKALSRTHKVLALSELPFHCGKKKINEEIQRISSAADECRGEKGSTIRTGMPLQVGRGSFCVWWHFNNVVRKIWKRR